MLRVIRAMYHLPGNPGMKWFVELTVDNSYPVSNRVSPLTVVNLVIDFKKAVNEKEFTEYIKWVSYYAQRNNVAAIGTVIREFLSEEEAPILGISVEIELYVYGDYSSVYRWVADMNAAYEHAELSHGFLAEITHMGDEAEKKWIISTHPESWAKHFIGPYEGTQFILLQDTDQNN